MKKKITALALSLALVLCGCGAQPAETEPAVTETVPVTTAEAPRPQNTTLTLMSEGEACDVFATLYQGDGYSLYIPDEEWEMTEPDHWTYVYNDAITFWSDRVVDETEESVRQQLLDGGYSLDPRTGLASRVQGNRYVTVQIYTLDGRIRTFCTSYPNSTEFMEGAGSTLDMIRDTFRMED